MRVEHWRLTGLQEVPEDEAVALANKAEPGELVAFWDCRVHGNHMLILSADHASDLQEKVDGSHLSDALIYAGVQVWIREFDDDTKGG